MLKISTYELQEKTMDIYLTRLEKLIGSDEFNANMLKSSMHIRSILQTLIDREKYKVRMITNMYTGKHAKIPYVNVMDTVYLKGGMIVDWLTLPRDRHVKDLDYSVSVATQAQVLKTSSHAQISARIERELRWLYSRQSGVTESELLDSLFDGYSEMEIYNAYDESKPVYVVKRNTIQLTKPRQFISHYSTMINENTELHRYYYSMYISQEGMPRQEIKLNIVDLSIDVTGEGSDFKYKSNLVKRYLDKTTYVITQSNLALLNDQLVSLLYSAVTLNVKYEKRKQRVYNLLLELENEEIRSSDIRLDDKRTSMSIERPFDVVYFCRYLCANGVNLKDWIVRVAEDKHISSDESQLRVCAMMEEVLPRVVRRFKVK